MDKKDGKNLPHKEIGIGLLGLGVIGSEFASTLINSSEELEKKSWTTDKIIWCSRKKY